MKNKRLQIILDSLLTIHRTLGEMNMVYEDYYFHQIGVYEKGDIVAFPQNTGYSQTYNGKSCLWIDGKGAPDGDVWFISKEEN